MGIVVNELRVGNWIKSIGFGNVKVYSILNNGLLCEHPIQFIPITFNIADPIPLTPEILEKCGFDIKINPIDGERTLYRKESISFYALKGKIQFERTEVIGNKITHIESLHQLQNLYFALTGEELTINL